ncbi:hypothetical protein [Taibaiella koreensis]|uniref:hypothetical protein n=1 Tax=Taibaiella koreensis TaxID=1268548 RepID=UPI0013C2CC8A|nr:hypothetical protein [Taibaiella koreensis]
MERGKKKEYLQKVKRLREQLCMSTQEGLDLLSQTEGDMERAAAVFKERMLHITTNFVKLPSEKVLPYLEEYKYDAGRAIDQMLDDFQLVDGVRQPKPVYILHKYRNNKKEALEQIGRLVETTAHLERDWKSVGLYEHPWLTTEALQSLDGPSQCVLALTEWLTFEDSEGLEQALLYNLDMAAAQIQLLKMPDLAAALRMARDIYREHEAIHHGPAFYKALNKDKDYQAARRFFQASREMLMDKLYAFVQAHLDQLRLPD